MKSIITVPETPVLTRVYQVSGAKVKVKYSVDVANDNVWHENTTVHIDSVNGMSVTVFNRAFREELTMLILNHAANVLNEFDLDKGCGHDQWLEQNGY